MVTRYVVGFMFDSNKEKVVLIEKQRPDWQKNLLNGVGGHIEAAESGIEAMKREFSEETGVDCPDWENYANLSDAKGHFNVEMFYAISDKMFEVVSKTDERVLIEWVKDLDKLNVIPNLRWLIPMALSFERGERCNTFFVTEVG